jgi:uncharacterized protein (DUF2147 family)
MKFRAMKWVDWGVAVNVCLLTLSFGFSMAAWGASTEGDLSGVLGLWMSFDDSTHEPSAQIRVTFDPKEGLIGRIEKVLDPKAAPGELCSACPGEKKNLPLVGLEIMHGGQKTSGEWLWSQGKILDPDSGDEYTYKLKLLEGSKELLLRGYWGPFWRTEKWSRVQ